MTKVPGYEFNVSYLAYMTTYSLFYRTYEEAEAAFEEECRDTDQRGFKVVKLNEVVLHYDGGERYSVELVRNVKQVKV